MHDKIFKNYSSLSNDKLEEFARELGLNMPRFEQDRNDSSSKQHLQHDLQNGVAAGVRGTPTIFINGRLLHMRSLAGFRKIIDSELRKINEGVKK